jgi:hypothetical protein
MGEVEWQLTIGRVDNQSSCINVNESSLKTCQCLTLYIPLIDCSLSVSSLEQEVDSVNVGGLEARSVKRESDEGEL